MSRSVKEIFRSVTLGVSAGVTTDVVFATAVNDYVGTIGTCPIGAVIKAVHLDVSYQSTAASSDQMDFYVAKRPAGSLPMPPAGITGGDPARRFIFYESTGINPDDDGAGPTKRQGWLMVPKRYQRMGEDDILLLKANAAGIYDLCVKVIYKWRT